MTLVSRRTLQVVLAAYLMLTVGALYVAGATSSDAFGAYNPSWDGGAGLQRTAETVGAEPAIVQNTTSIRDYPANRTAVVVFAPAANYSDADADRLSAFVSNGGTLLVADDFGGHANDLLSKLDARARIDGRLLRDERHYYRSPALPVATDVADHALTENVTRLTLNYGTILRPNGATVLVASSEYAYLDANRNGELDDEEDLESSPVASIEARGAGRILVVSDPSVFINAMLERRGNDAFARTLLGQVDYVVFDYSHGNRVPPVALALLVIRSSALAQLLLAIAGLGVIGAWGYHPALFERLRGRLSRRTPPEIDSEPVTVASVIDAAYPEWDDDRTRRVIQGINTRDAKDEHND